MTKNMDYYEQIRAHIEYEGEHIACNEENLQTHLKVSVLQKLTQIARK